MAETSKPDFQYVWASGGSIVAPSNVKIQTGWTAEVPPFQWENWSQNRQDAAISHILQKGISVWSATGEYYFTTSGERSYVQGSDGSIYVAVADSVGIDPTTDAVDAYWKVAFIDSTSLATFSASTGPVVGSVRNGVMSITSAATTATYTADEVILKSALVGTVKTIGSFNKTINLATTGAGGMDTGTAPVSGYVAVYAIYNPTTGVSALLAKDATSGVQTEVYSGVNMPSGYTLSTLLTVVATNASSQFLPVYVSGRTVWISPVQIYTSSVQQATLTLRDASLALPFNAKTVDLSTSMASSAASVTLTSTVAGSGAAAGGIGQKVNSITSGASGGAGLQSQFPNIPVITPQTIYYSVTIGSGTLTFSISISGYSI